VFQVLSTGCDYQELILPGTIVICTLDGIEVFCEEGDTILKAAQSANVEIPLLCYHPELTLSGSCRICVVEVEGEHELLPACSTPVKSGMVIYTASERVLEARRIILEMMLSQHFGDCLTCDESGECLLEKYAYDYGATGSLFQKAEYDEKIHGIDDYNPLIILDRGKCILCGRCVRACEEWSHANAISFVNKGHKMSISTLYDKGLEANHECIFCGACISVCPTAAFYEKQAVRAGRIPEITRTRTICPYCGVGCGLIVYSRDGKIIKVRGDDDSPVSRGRLCIKGKFGLDFVNSEERLRKPLVRGEDGEFHETSMVEALVLIKEKIEDIRREKGNFAGIGSGKCTNEDNYIFQKFLRSVLKTDNVDHCARICHSPSVTALRMTMGSGAMTNPIADIEHIDCFMVVGSNMTATHPVIAWQIMSRIRQGAILILVDPRKSDLAPYATLHLQLIPGSDIALFNAMMKIILEESMHDMETIRERVEGYDEFAHELEQTDFSSLVKETGLSEDDIRLAARLYAISGASSIYYTMGITQHVFGTDNVTSLSNLALICGKVGSGPMGINPLRGQNNVQGASDMGIMPGLLPGYQSLQDKDTRHYFNDAWGAPLPEKKGRTMIEILNLAGDGLLDFLYVMGENPAVTDPDTTSVEKALEKTGFLVVQDMFLTETARFADVVLPAASFAEKDGTYTNTERRVQRLNKVIDFDKEVMEDWIIITQLANLLGAGWNYSNWEDVFNEMKEVTGLYKHLSIDSLSSGNSFWPADHKGKPVERMYQNSFNRENGKALLLPVSPTGGYRRTEQYPFLLIIGRMYEHYHSRSMTGRVEGINNLQPKSLLYLNPRDALHLKVRDDDMVRVTSSVGVIEIACRISLEVKPATLFMTFHFKDAMANRLTSKEKLDPVSKMAAMKVVPVSIMRIEKKQD
jgi:formate dehydrogenase alpha subunit